MLNAFSLILFNPINLLLIVAGIAGGFIVGVLPGLGTMFAIVVLLPFTLKLVPEMGVMVTMAIFISSACGGAVSAALIGIPGTPMAVSTLLDAYPLANQRKQPRKAIGLAIFASAFGGIVSAFFLAFGAPLLADVATAFGPAEYTILIALGLLSIAYVTQGEFTKGLLSGLVGLALAAVGLDQATLVERYTFGVSALQGGFDLIPILLGLFAIPELISMLERKGEVTAHLDKFTAEWPSLKELRTYWLTYIKSSIIGTVVGVLPGAGATMAPWVSYGEQTRASKNPEKMGTGQVEGVIASEASNNGVTGGALIPTLTLGIPGSPAMAVVMGLLFSHGLTPGPQLFSLHPDLLNFIYAGMFVGNILLLLIGMFFTKPFVAAINMDKELLVPAIAVVCFLGIWGLEPSFFNVWTMLVVGAFSYFLRKMDVPLAPLVLGFILGPLFENNLRRALAISRGNPLTFVSSPAAIILIVLFVGIGWGAYRTMLATRKKVEDRGAQ